MERESSGQQSSLVSTFNTDTHSVTCDRQEKDMEIHDWYVSLATA